jgi:hypothetical protein
MLPLPAIRRLCLIAGVLVCLTLGVAAQSEWSGWMSTRGGDANLEYRWRKDGMCLAQGCGKDLQFRNLGKTTLRFDYTVWAKGMTDPGDEVKQTGSTSVGGEQSTNVGVTMGADIVRVTVQMH